MLEYALEKLVDGISLPGVLLIVFPIALLHWWVTSKRWFFLPLCLMLVAMSLPVTGKLLLYPLEIGVPFGDVKPEDLSGKIDAVVVLSNGLYQDPLASAFMPNTASFFRIKRGEILAAYLDIPLIISGADQVEGGKTDAEILADLLTIRNRLILVSGARGTAEHANNIQTVTKDTDIKRLAVFVSGIHAYRTVAVFQKYGLDVPFAIVGLRHSVFQLTDMVPSFIGFFYWKHALKEYAGLAYSYWNDDMSVQ